MDEKSAKDADGQMSEPPGPMSRRHFLRGVGLAAGAATVPLSLAQAEEAKSPGLGPGAAKFRLRVNGQERTVEAEPRMTLAEVLRDELDLTGTKIVCDRGACGGCTVMLDGESVCACMMWALDAREKDVLTIEGLAAPDGTLDPVQAAFVEHDAQQCGFCTPGLVMRARAFLNENPHPTLEDVKQGLAGNICRCGTYTHVFQAVLTAAGKGEAKA